MIRHLIILVVSVMVGAVLALVVRSALHRPYAAQPMAPAMPAILDKTAPPMPTPATTTDPHAGHAPTASAKPINTLCSICGMNVDPKLPTTTFRQQTVGFACLACPPTFAKDPERYGPFYLRNEKAPK